SQVLWAWWRPSFPVSNRLSSNTASRSIASVLRPAKMPSVPSLVSAGHVTQTDMQYLPCFYWGTGAEGTRRRSSLGREVGPRPLPREGWGPAGRQETERGRAQRIASVRLATLSFA